MDHPLRIAYLCLQATTEGQASHAHVHEIIDGLVALGHTVDLYEPRYAGRKAPGALGRAVEFARVQRRLVRRLDAYDLLYVRGHPLALPAARAARRLEVPIVQECNGPYEDFPQAWPSTRPIAGILAAMSRAQYRAADALIAVTPQLAEWLARDTGRSDIQVVPNGANVELFKPGLPKPEGLPERYVIFFGALQPWQGVRTILEAVRDDAWPAGLPLVVLGDGLLTDEVKLAAAKYPDKVWYLGRLPYHGVPPIVANAVASLVGLSAARRSGGPGSPLKLYESMAAGVPVVAGDRPGQAEIVREAGCGVLVKGDDPRALADSVARLAADPVACREMGMRGREAVVDEHSWFARARQVSDVVVQSYADARLKVAEVVLPARRKIAYLSLQAVVEGQDTWAAVTEIVNGIRAQGWEVDEYWPDYHGHAKPGVLRRLSQMWRVQRRLARHLREYDALYIRSHPMAWPTSWLARRSDVPVVQECNGPYEDLFIAWPSTRLARPLFEAVQRTQYRHASAVISVADGLTEWLVADTHNRRVLTNGNGANVEVFTPDAPRRAGLPERFAVFFGQFPAWQGIQTLLEAVRLPEWPRSLPLVFVGDGALRPDIERAAASMPDRVRYVGRLPYAEVAQVAAHAVVSYVPMVAPEREAKFSPLKLYESMACGVPVIASDTIGISEVVNEADCGILVQAGDADAIARATASLLADEAEAHEMGRRGRETVLAEYSWAARARQRLRIVEAAIEWEQRKND